MVSELFGSTKGASGLPGSDQVAARQESSFLYPNLINNEEKRDSTAQSSFKAQRDPVLGLFIFFLL
jgi:hypothetical protein